MIRNLSPSKWPFKNPEFGNLEQLNFLKLECEKERLRNEIEVKLRNHDYEYAEKKQEECEGGCGCDKDYYACPECGCEGNDFDDLIERVSYEDVKYGQTYVDLCRMCGTHLKK